MAEELLKEIFEDLYKIKDLAEELKSASEQDLIFYYETVGQYIRNIFLWKSQSNVDLLSKHYKCSQIYKLSFLILKDFYYIIKK